MSASPVLDHWAKYEYPRGHWPLAWVIIGGLISSTLVARIVTPVMYKLIPPTIEVKNAAREPLVGQTHVSPATLQ